MRSGALELIVEKVYSSGLAYFRDVQGREYVRKPRSSAIDKALLEDFHYFVHHCGSLSYLAEPHRKFASAEEATRYISAVTAFDRLLAFVPLTLDTTIDAYVRSSSRELFKMTQELLRKEYLPVLESIPAFADVADYLRSSPEQIYAREYGSSKKKK